MSNFLDSVEKNNEGMGSFSLSIGENLVFEKTFGKCNLEKQIPISYNTKFRIGSITKTFTAVCILQMAQEGKLDLEEPISNYFPEIPQAEQINISQLLHHRSGLHNFTDDDDFLQYLATPQSKKEHFARIISKGIDFEPGSKYSYSNTNYVLLAFICETIDKTSFEKLIDKRIVKPLKLKNTYHAIDYAIEKEEALSYFWDEDWKLASKTHGTTSIGAGSIVSTTADLNKFLNAIETGKLLKPFASAEMKNMVDDYGCGLYPMPWKKYEGVGHTGGIDGFQSVFFHLFEQDIYVSFCGNALKTDRDVIVNNLLKLYFEEVDTVSLPWKKVVIPTETLANYEGIFSSADLDADIEITNIDGELFAQSSNQQIFTFENINDTTFQFEEGNIKIIFQQEGNAFTLIQDLGNFNFVRAQKKETED